MTSTRPIFIRTRSPKAAAALIEELQGQGMPERSLRVYGKEVPKGFPARLTRWRPPARSYLEGGAFGLGAMVVIAVMLGGFGTGAALYLIAAAALGAGLWRWRARAAMAPVASQAAALNDGDLILRLELEDDRLGPFEARLAERHPELMILGGDAAGTPPFP